MTNKISLQLKTWIEMSSNPFSNTFFSFGLVYLFYHHNDKLTRPQDSKKNVQIPIDSAEIRKIVVDLYS